MSLSLVTGNNGILGKAKTSADKTKEASAKEQVELKVAEFQQEFYEAVYVNNEADVNTKKGDWIAQNKTGEQKTEDYTFTITGSAPYKVTIKKDKTIKSDIIGSLSEDGILSWGGFSSQITADNYGDKINYSANGITDWKIFYNDGINVFLIASYYLPIGKVPLGATMTTTGTYQAYWSSAPSAIQTVDDAILTKFKHTGFTLNSSNDNSKCVSTLLNHNNWTNLVNGKAEYAIGSPTVEMWIASWNEKYLSDQLYCNKTNSNGYYVGTGSDPTSTYISPDVMKEKDGYKNTTLYCPHQSSEFGFL